MTYANVYYPTPEDFLSVAEEMDSGPTVVLSGPEIRQDAVYHNSNDFEVVRSLSECTKDYDKLVIIDDFYLCYMQYKESDNEKYCSAFEQLVTKETTYLATRIYSFQWMLKNENINQQFNLQTANIINICYGKDEAIYKCRELNPNIEDEIIQKHIEQTLYETSLNIFDDVIDYQSYIPRVLTTVIENDTSSSILPSQVQDLIGTSFAHSNIAGALMDLQAKIPKSVTSDAKRSINRVLPSVLGASAVSTGLYHFVIPLTVYWNFIRGKDERRMQEFFGELLSDDMLPHSREKLEEELGLPPRTIETLQNVTRPQILADISSSIKRNELDAAELIDEVYENSEQIEELEQIGKFLSERIQPLEEHYEESIETALQDYTEIIKDENKRKKQTLIDELGYSKESSDTVLESLVGLDLREDEIENIRENLGFSSTILIRGPIGVGKSHFIYELSDRLAEDGKTVKYCYPDDIADLKTGLKQLSSEDNEIVLVCKYRGGDLNPDRFRRIFGKEIYNLYDFLIVECNESSYHEFRKVWEEILDTREDEAANRLEPHKDLNIELDELSTVKPIPRALEIIDESVLESIEAISEGNPLVAFEASILALSGENWETGIGKRGILRKRLDSICTHFENATQSDVDPTKLLKAAAIIGTVDNLQSIPVIAGSSDTGGAMEFIRTSLNRYIVDEGDHWRLKPDYIRRILFEDTWFKTGEDPERLNDHRLDYIRRIKENNIGFISCATNLGELWQLANQSEIPVSEELVTEAVDELLDKSAETRSYSDCLFQFAISGIPLSSSLVQRDLYEWSDNWINIINKDEEGDKILLSIISLAENNIIYRSDLQEFFDLSETGRVFITYIQNSLSELSLDQVLLYYSELISTYIHRRAPDVVGSSKKMDYYAEKLEWMINEYGKSCTEQTDPENPYMDIEMTDEDIKANLYTLTISSLMARFEPDDIDGHIHYFMNKYRDCYTDEEKSSDGQLYSRIIIQLSFKTSADHGRKWLRWIHKAHLQRGMTTPLPEFGENFMKFQAYCIMNLFRRTVMGGKEINGKYYLMPDEEDLVESNSSLDSIEMYQIFSSHINDGTDWSQIDKAISQGKLNEFRNRQLFDWWMLLLDLPGCLRAVIEIMFENQELREPTKYLFGFIHDGIPSLGEKYGFGEEAEEIVSKRFKEIRERYPGVLEDR